MAPTRMKPSPIGFGAFKIGRNEGIKYPVPYSLPDEAEVGRLLNGVLDLGINLIDTAPAYGLSEERIGRHLAHRRDEFMVSTKVGERFRQGKSHYDFSRTALRKSVQCSLARLGRESLDLVFVHSSRDDLRVIEKTDVVPTLLDLKEEGLIRSVGFSGYTSAALKASLVWADAIMIEYSLEQQDGEEVLAEAGSRKIQAYVKKGLGSGRLKPPEAIRFVLSNPHVTCLVIGSLSLEHLGQAVEIGRRERRL